MPRPTFRGDPYHVLDVPSDASEATIKRRWRELAQEHHPDRAGADPDEASRSTRRMARINAAYDLLRDPERRAGYDAHAERNGHRPGRNGSRPAGAGSEPGGWSPKERDRPSGPPPSPPTRPVTGRFDASSLFHRRNTVTSEGRPNLSGLPPIPNRERAATAEPRRASTPTGPVERRTGRRKPLPSLDEALGTPLEFGKFRGHTLGEVAAFEPTYVDWIARTITRDRDLVVRARVIQAELDRRGVERRSRPPTPGSGTSGSPEADG